jgi:hypothetical protein
MEGVKLCRHQQRQHLVEQPPAAQQRELEQVVRREALRQYLEGREEEALDLLAVARALAPAEPRISHSSTIGSSPMHPMPKTPPPG